MSLWCQSRYAADAKKTDIRTVREYYSGDYRSLLIRYAPEVRCLQL
jgi:hypothetical protein